MKETDLAGVRARKILEEHIGGSSSFYTCWDSCDDPEGLLYLAKAGGATHKQVVFALCAVVRLCLPRLESTSASKAIETIETTEAWCRGGATKKQVTAAKRALQDDWEYYESTYTAVIEVCEVHKTNYYYYQIYHTLQADIEVGIVCSTIRKHLVFERPKMLTFWQRLAEGCRG